MLTRMCFHSATISTISMDYNSLLMLQSSPFNVNVTDEINNFIALIKSACRFGHSKEKNRSSCIFTSSRILPIQYQKHLLKLPGDYKLSKSSIFKVQAF